MGNFGLLFLAGFNDQRSNLEQVIKA